MRFFLIFLLLLTFLNSSSLNNKFYEAKKDYVQAILNSNKQKEIKSLKKIVYYGTLLKKDIKKYKKELNRLKVAKISNRDKNQKNNYNISKIYIKNNNIVIQFKNKVKSTDLYYKTTTQNNKFYYLFYIKGKLKKTYKTKFKTKLAKIKISQISKNKLKISIISSNRLSIEKSIYKKTVILKLNRYIYIQKTTKIVKPPIYQNNKKKIIVIDPGHGGKDSGAIGWGYKEKNIVLSIAKKLYKELKRRGFKVYLTRDKDYFISLRYRTHFANRKKADIFVSIHANSVANKNKRDKVKGVETYFLSPARSNRAKRAAALENRKTIAGMNYNTKNIFLNILNNTKINYSRKLGIDIQKNIIYNLRKIYKQDIIDGGVKEAPFWVLVGALMPAVLIEVGYISNKYEAKRISSYKFQQKISKAIADGIESYLRKNNI